MRRPTGKDPDEGFISRDHGSLKVSIAFLLVVGSLGLAYLVWHPDPASDGIGAGTSPAPGRPASLPQGSTGTPGSATAVRPAEPRKDLLSTGSGGETAWGKPNAGTRAGERAKEADGGNQNSKSSQGHSHLSAIRPQSIEAPREKEQPSPQRSIKPVVSALVKWVEGKGTGACPELSAFFSDASMAQAAAPSDEAQDLKVTRLLNNAKACEEWIAKPEILHDKAQGILSDIFGLFEGGKLGLWGGIDCSIAVLDQVGSKLLEARSAALQTAQEVDRVAEPFLIEKVKVLEDRKRKRPESDELRQLHQIAIERLHDAAGVKGRVQGKADILERRRLQVEVLIDTLRLERDTLGQKERNPPVLPSVRDKLGKILF